MTLQQILIAMFHALESGDLNTYKNLRPKAIELVASVELKELEENTLPLH
ncbi:hypothetical protein [Bdellovibrio bacteriovorus]|nr:hypothetical protein [Bdellovibrio bacteriovorus]